MCVLKCFLTLSLDPVVNVLSLGFSEIISAPALQAKLFRYIFCLDISKLPYTDRVLYKTIFSLLHNDEIS